MKTRDPLLPLSVAIGLALLAALLGIVSVAVLHDSIENMAEIQVERVRRSGELESARLRVAHQQQALLVARSEGELKTARTDLMAARAELVASMDRLAAVEDTEGQQRVRLFAAAVQGYFQVLDRLVPLLSRRSHQRAGDLVQGASETAFRQYVAEVEAVREWARQLPVSTATRAPMTLSPVSPLAGPAVGPDGAPVSLDVEASGPPFALAWEPPPEPQVDLVALHRTLTDVVEAAWALRSVTQEAALGRHGEARTKSLGEEASARSRELLMRSEQLIALVQPARPELIDGLTGTITLWQVMNREVMRLAGERSDATAHALAANEAAPRLGAARAAAVAIAEGAEAGVREVRRAAAETYSTALVTLIPALLLAIGAALMVGISMTRQRRPAGPSVPLLAAPAAPRALAARAGASASEEAVPAGAAADQPAEPVEPAAATASDSEAPSPSKSAAISVADDTFTIQELSRRTDLLAFEAEMAAARMDDLGKSFADVASEVRQLAERSRAAVDEISALPPEGAERGERERALVDQMLPHVEVLATLVIEMSSTVRVPGQSGHDIPVENALVPGSLGPSPWTEASRDLEGVHSAS